MTMLTRFPSAYPDESLYSLLARHMRQSESLNTHQVVKALYGNSKKRADHFYVSDNVPLFEGFEHMNLSSEAFIFKYTLYPYYAAFLPKCLGQYIVQKMISSNEHDLHKIIEFDRNINYLKHCPDCMEEDRRLYDETYWHRTHQLPGVFICPQHQTPLVTLKHLHSNKCLLASAASFKESALPKFSKATTDILLFIARESQWLLHQRVSMYDLNSYRDKFLLFLKKEQMVSLSGRINQRQWFALFTHHYSEECLNLLQANVTPHNCWLQAIVRKHTKVFHPVQNLLVIKLMANSLQEFFKWDIGTGPLSQHTHIANDNASQAFQK